MAEHPGCPICRNEWTEVYPLTLCCGHSVCRDCWAQRTWLKCQVCDGNLFREPVPNIELASAFNCKQPMVRPTSSTADRMKQWTEKSGTAISEMVDSLVVKVEELVCNKDAETLQSIEIPVPDDVLFYMARVNSREEFTDKVSANRHDASFYQTLGIIDDRASIILGRLKERLNIKNLELKWTATKEGGWFKRVRTARVEPTVIHRPKRRYGMIHKFTTWISCIKEDELEDHAGKVTRGKKVVPQSMSQSIIDYEWPDEEETQHPMGLVIVIDPQNCYKERKNRNHH